MKNSSKASNKSFLIETARNFFSEGFNIVAVKLEKVNREYQKKPLTDWGHWLRRRQTKEEFEQQPWNEADAFGIILSWPDNVGRYLAVVDFDAKKTSPEAQKKGRELLRKFPITWMEKTANGGIHLLYYSRVKPERVSDYHDSYALELLAGNCICIVAPSRNGLYYKLNDNEVREVEDIEGMFYQILGVEDPRRKVAGKFPRETLGKWFEEIKPHLDIKGESEKWVYCHCPFHTPDRNPSLAISKESFYVYDFHSGERYGIKELAKRLGVKLSSVGNGIDLEHLEGKTWRVVGVGSNKLTITIKRGRDLLTRSEFKWLRKKIGDLDEVIELAEKVEEKYREQEEKEKEDEVEEEKPGWLEKKELLDTAEKEVVKKLEEFIGLPEGERIEKYHDWLRNVVLRDIMAGEDDNKVCGFVIILFGKKYILLLQGKSSIGKNLLVYSFIQMTEHYKTNRVTRYGLDYLSPEEVYGKILYLKEAEDFEGHFGFVLKSLEDFEDEEWITYIVTYPVRDEKTGKITTYTQTSLKLKALVSTTNIENILTPGVQERMFFLRLDDSTEQNRRVLQFIDKEETQKQEIKQGLRRWTDREWSLALTYCLWRKLSEINDEIIIPFDNLAEVVLGALASDTEVRRHARKLRRYVEWFARAFIIFLPVVEINGKKVRVVTLDVLKPAVRYFYHLIEAKKEFKTPFVLKFAKKLIETYKDESNPNGQCIELRKTSREVLARKLGYRPDSLNRYLNQLHDEAPLAVEKYNVGKEVIHRINLQELATWASEFLDTQPLTLSDDQARELEEAFNRWMQKHTPSHTVDPFLPTLKTSESGLIQADKPENVGKPAFPLFSERSELEKLENGRNNVGRKDGGVEGGERIVLSQSKTLINGSAPLLQPAESRVCRDCVYWDALKCLKHQDWLVVTPTARYARTCDFYTPKNNGGG